RPGLRRPPSGVRLPAAGGVRVSRLRPDTADALLRELAVVQAETQQPSLVAGVVRSGALVWTAARGRHAGDVDPGPDVQYRIGSITKTLTAIAVMQCRDEGLVELDAPAATVLG